MKKKGLLGLLALVCTFASGTLVSCAEKSLEGTAQQAEIKQIYAEYVAHAENSGDAPLSYEDWLESIKGATGEKGDKGEQGEKGEAGKSAYEIWLDLGNEGTEADFIASLKGEKGEQGEKGEDGKDGADGANGTDGKDGMDGADGKSAYEIWLEQGHEGTEEDFLLWLQGGCLHTDKVAWSTMPHFMADGVVKAGYTVYYCTGCNMGIIQFENEIVHDFIEVEHDATCTQDGYRGLECTICGYVYGETIPALGHELISGEWIIDKEPTCEEEGHKYKICGREGCDEWVDEAEIEKLPPLEEHQHRINGMVYEFERVYNLDVVTGITELDGFEASCSAEGQGYFLCSDCGAAVKIKTTRNHTLDETKVNVTLPATCTEDGTQEIWCTVEEDYVSEEGNDAFVIPATGHSFVYDPFQDAGGTWWVRQTCNNDCGHDEYIELDKEPEVIEEATCQKEGKLLLTFTVDGAEMTLLVPIPKTNHTLPNGELYAEGQIINVDEVDGITELFPATCTSTGKGYFICRYCSASVMVTTTRNHDYEIVEEKAPTDTEEGYRKYVCAVCGEESIEVLPAIGSLS